VSRSILCLTIACAALAGCQPDQDGSASEADAAATVAEVVTGPVAPGLDRIACALGGSQEFASSCEVERLKDAEGLHLVVRHPDGGFRRFDVLDDGRGLAVSDGALQSETEFVDGLAQVSVGKDRYRIPATQAGDDAKP